MSQSVILVLNGPNLNLLGQREPERYGTETLSEIEASLRALVSDAPAGSGGSPITLAFQQSNHEGDLIDAVQQARHTTVGLIINPGGYGHTSIALRDALVAYPHPAVEVHLSNIYAREGFRRHSLLSDVVTGVICGLGADGYRLALRSLLSRVSAG